MADRTLFAGGGAADKSYIAENLLLTPNEQLDVLRQQTIDSTELNRLLGQKREYETCILRLRKQVRTLQQKQIHQEPLDQAAYDALPAEQKAMYDRVRSSNEQIARDIDILEKRTDFARDKIDTLRVKIEENQLVQVAEELTIREAKFLSELEQEEREEREIASETTATTSIHAAAPVVPELSPEQTQAASEALIHGFPRVNRETSATCAGQNYTLLSMMIAEEAARACRNQIVGMVKVHGTFPSEQDAVRFARKIVRKHDSTRTLAIGICGQWHPLAVEVDRVCMQIDNVKDPRQKSQQQPKSDTQKQIEQFLNTYHRKMRDQEKKSATSRTDRIRELQEDSQTPCDKKSLEWYCTLHVQRQQLLGYIQTRREEIATHQEKALRTIREIDVLDQEFPAYRTLVKARIEQQRKKFGINESFDPISESDTKDLTETDPQTMK